MNEPIHALDRARRNPEFFELANCIRSLSIDAVEAAGSGHPGAPMGLADAAAVLWARHLKFDPTSPQWPDRDRFVLSNGHGSMLLYSLLYLTGFTSISREDLQNFRQWGSSTAGHPEYGHLPGVEITTGPLGQGLAGAVGMAMAERSLAARFGAELVDHRTWVVCGDGCLMEGISQEAISLAGHQQLGKLTVLYDDNGISIDGPTGKAFTEDVEARFRAAGWQVLRCGGHDHDAIDAALETVTAATDRPSLVMLETVIGLGSPNKAGQASSHGAPLGADELALTRQCLGWDAGPFEIPEALLDKWRRFGKRGKLARQQWRSRRDDLTPERRQTFDRCLAGQLPEELDEAVAEERQALLAEPVSVATRKASQMALERLTRLCPSMLGGSADLTGSNLTRVAAVDSDFTAANPAGRYVSYGVREFGMAAAMNGMAVHGGVIPYGGTFLVFSDYARNAIRLSALMRVGVVYVMTHDSIGLGEDGPTHQPVEHLASFRAMPGITVFRPADAVETLEAWQVALENRDRPTLMALSRQGVPQLRRDEVGENLTARGGYVIRHYGTGRDLTLLATGTEVSLAVEAARTLHDEDGTAVSVVSLPSWDLFERNDDRYRAEVLGEAPRIAVEAAGKFGWTRYVDSEADVIGLDGFGASAPAPVLYEQFGITASAIVDRARVRLGGGRS